MALLKINENPYIYNLIKDNMKLKYLLIIGLVLSSGVIIGQQSLNEYKYVIVPNKFDFLKYDDQYQLNSLTKFLFNKEGFQTLFVGDERPGELNSNTCLGLTSSVNNISGLLNTKLVIELVNCRNEIVFTSTEGRSKEKDYKKGYHEALREAFKSITELNYSYTPVKALVVPQNEVEKEKVIIPAMVEEAIEVKEPEVIEKAIEAKEVDMAVTNIVDEEVEVVKNVVKVEEVKVAELSAPANLLYAQANPQGYQLVDSTPKVVYILLKTGKAEVYILKNKNGILFKQDSKWVAEYYEENKLIKRVLEIKF